MTTSALSEASVLRDWDARSGVRAKPRKMVNDLEEGKVLFPRKLLPVAQHPVLEKADPRLLGSILTNRLYLYFDFTRALEQEIVNPVLARVSRGIEGVSLSPEMRKDAHRIYVDEAYHALAAIDLNLQVWGATDVPYQSYTRHRFQGTLTARLDDLQDRVDPHLVQLCAAIVSETLISGTLSQIPSDESVATVVREAVAEHADDERCHHAYFTKLHEHTWPRLAETTRRQLAPLFGDFILAFLLPDTDALSEMLQRAGLDDHVVNTLLHDSYDDLDPLPGIRQAARATLRLLLRTGVLDHPGVREHYARLGLTTS